MFFENESSSEANTWMVGLGAVGIPQLSLPLLDQASASLAGMTNAGNERAKLAAFFTGKGVPAASAHTIAPIFLKLYMDAKAWGTTAEAVLEAYTSYMANPTQGTSVVGSITGTLPASMPATTKTLHAQMLASDIAKLEAAWAQIPIGGATSPGNVAPITTPPTTTPPVTTPPVTTPPVTTPPITGGGIPSGQPSTGTPIPAPPGITLPTVTGTTTPVPSPPATTPPATTTTPDNTVYWVVGGVLGAAAVGAALYFLLRAKPGATPAAAPAASESRARPARRSARKVRRRSRR